MTADAFEPGSVVNGNIADYPSGPEAIPSVNMRAAKAPRQTDGHQGLTINRGRTTPGAVAAWMLSVGAYVTLPTISRHSGVRRLAKRCRERRALCLSYDDGPGPCLTLALLEVLREYEAKATFFVLGARARQSPKVVRTVVEAGHEIGAHSDDHLHGWKHGPVRSLRDVRGGFAELNRCGGVRPRLHRPPYGKLNCAAWLEARSQGARIAWWTIDSGDVRSSPPSPQSVVDSVRGSQGGVVLMHDFDRTGPDGAARADHVLQTTSALLAMARDENLNVLPMSDLFAPR